MKQLRKTAGWAMCWGMMLVGLLLAGCQTQDQRFLEFPTGNSGGPTAGNTFRVGDTVTINFSGPVDPIAAHTERIKDDGTITLDYIGAVVAAGKTSGELQKIIHDKYVPNYYRDLTVTVTSPSQVYYVGGEVRSPGPHEYLGETDVIKAIQSAGDFTEFANKKSVLVTRANGHQQKVNVLKAIEDPSFDVPVYPGDKVIVRRRLF